MNSERVMAHFNSEWRARDILEPGLGSYGRALSNVKKTYVVECIEPKIQAPAREA